MAIMMELGMQYKERTIEIKMKQTRVSLIKLCAFNEIRYNVSHPTPKVPLFIRSDIKRAVGLIRLKCVVATMHYIYKLHQVPVMRIQSRKSAIPQK